MGKPVSIKEIISRVMNEKGAGADSFHAALLREWETIIGTTAAAEHSRPVKYKNSVLVVCVENSCYVHELTLHKRAITARIKSRFPQQAVKDIRFKVGSVRAGTR